MPHSFPTTEHLHKWWGRPPGLRPTPPSACWRLHEADIVVPAAGRGRPARTRGSALQLTSGPRCRENYVALGRIARPALRQERDSPTTSSPSPAKSPAAAERSATPACRPWYRSEEHTSEL